MKPAFAIGRWSQHILLELACSGACSTGFVRVDTVIVHDIVLAIVNDKICWPTFCDSCLMRTYEGAQAQ